MSRTSVPLQEENDKDRKSKGRPSKKPQTKATRKPTKNRETVIDEFLTKAKTLYADGPNEENVNALFDEYDSIGRETEKKGKGSKTNDECVLISLIKHSKWRLEEDEDLLKRFLRRILSKWPHLVVEKADIPPLIWGLRRRCGLLVDSILDMNDASYALEKTFWDQNHGNESCLHIAIRRGSPSSQIELLTSRLCERYPDVLLKTNRHGNTPLHELVGRIGEEVDPEKLEAEYRIWQEIQELKKATKKNTDNKTKGGRNDLLDSTKEEVGKTDNAEEVEEAEEAEQEGEREGAGEVEEDGEDDDEDDEDEEYTELSQDCRCAIIKMMIGRAQKQIERTNVLLATKNNESRTSYQKRIERLNEVLKRLTWFNKLNSSTQEQFYREIVAKDPIARVIREYCMRELPSSEIVNCLYTPSTGKDFYSLHQDVRC